MVSDGVDDRIIGLGHSVTQLNTGLWDDSFDYSPCDLVAFDFGTSNPASIPNLVAAVDAGDVGAVFFRGTGAEQTMVALDTGRSEYWQSRAKLNVVNTSHPVTAGLAPDTFDPGFVYSTQYTGVGSDMTVLETLPRSGCTALAVHNTRRVALSYFYGHFSVYSSETQASIDLTEGTLQ